MLVRRWIKATEMKQAAIHSYLSLTSSVRGTSTIIVTIIADFKIVIHSTETISTELVIQWIEDEKACVTSETPVQTSIN